MLTRMFISRCPIEIDMEVWSYLRVSWLLERFGGKDFLTGHQLLPSDPRFTSITSIESGDADGLFGLACEIMQVDGSTVALEVVPDEKLANAVGTYVREGADARIQLAQSQLSDPTSALATLSHELAHHVLLGQGHLSGEEPDHELVTDLFTAIRGCGIFSANCTVREQSERNGRWYWWQISKQGYLPARVFGWALALVTWIRQDVDRSWSHFLRLDAREAFTHGMKYLKSHGIPTQIGGLATLTSKLPEPSAFVHALLDKRTVMRLLALRVLSTRPDVAVNHSERIAVLLKDRSAEVRSEAAAILGNLGSLDERAKAALVVLLQDKSAEVRTAAAISIGRTLPTESSVLEELSWLLTSDAWREVDAAAWALGQYGSRAEEHAAQLLRALQRCLVKSKYGSAEVILDALIAICSCPNESISNYFADDELRLLALDSLKLRQQSVQNAAV